MTFNNSLVFQPSILPPALPQSQLLTYFTKKMEAVRREKPPNLLTYSYSAFPVVEAIEPSLPSQITLPLLHWIPSASLTHPFAVIPSYSCIPTNKLSALSQIFKKPSLEPKLFDAPPYGKNLQPPYPFSSNPPQSSFHSHHSAKTILVKVISNLHVAKFQGSICSRHFTWPLSSICCARSFPSWKTSCAF